MGWFGIGCAVVGAGAAASAAESVLVEDDFDQGLQDWDARCDDDRRAFDAGWDDGQRGAKFGGRGNLPSPDHEVCGIICTGHVRVETTIQWELVYSQLKSSLARLGS